MRLLLLLLATLLVSGCGSASYAGGPEESQPHGLVYTGEDISIWRIDGRDTYSRQGVLLVAPGLRKLKVRLQHPMEAETEGYEMKEVDLRVEEKHIYLLERTPDGEFGPYEVKITERKG